MQLWSPSLFFRTLSFFVCLRTNSLKPQEHYCVNSHTSQQQKGKIRKEKKNKYWTRYAQWPGSYNKTTQHAFTTLIGSEINKQTKTTVTSKKNKIKKQPKNHENHQTQNSLPELKKKSTSNINQHQQQIKKKKKTKVNTKISSESKVSATKRPIGQQRARISRRSGNSESRSSWPAAAAERTWDEDLVITGTSH